MRNSCWNCTIKHLGDAAIWEIEYRLGYKEFYVYIIGSLNHASTEVYKFYPALAHLIREHRLAFEDNDMYDIPYETIAEFVLQCAACQEDGLPMPVIPDHIKAPKSNVEELDKMLA